MPLGPLYGDVANGMAVEHALTRTVRDSALLLDLTAGPGIGDPYPAPPLARPLAEEIGVDPARLRIAVSTRRADGEQPHPDCVAAVDQAVALLTDLGHEVIEADLPGLTEEVGHAIGTMFDALTAWIAAYWTRSRGREPRPDELEPLTWAYWQAGRGVSAADYLQAVETTQRFSRTVATFLTTYDCFLTPTMSAPPAPIGWITSTADDPYRALRRGGQTVAYAGGGRQPHRQPGDVGPDDLDRRGPPDGNPCPRPVRRRGHPDPARQPDRDGPPLGRQGCRRSTPATSIRHNSPTEKGRNPDEHRHRKRHQQRMSTP